jgi:hypothetical protein
MKAFSTCACQFASAVERPFQDTTKVGLTAFREIASRDSTECIADSLRAFTKSLI